jgi:hypothetical protein
MVTEEKAISDFGISTRGRVKALCNSTARSGSEKQGIRTAVSAVPSAAASG